MAQFSFETFMRGRAPAMVFSVFFSTTFSRPTYGGGVVVRNFYRKCTPFLQHYVRWVKQRYIDPHDVDSIRRQNFSSRKKNARETTKRVFEKKPVL